MEKNSLANSGHTSRVKCLLLRENSTKAIPYAAISYIENTVISISNYSLNFGHIFFSQYIAILHGTQAEPSDFPGFFEVNFWQKLIRNRVC